MRGDLRAVVRAILLDAEARRGDTTPLAGDGHLREPVLYLLAMLRNLGASVTDATQLYGNGQNMGQRLLYSPTVFNYYPPDWIIQGTTLYGPEFELQTTANAAVRANFVNSVMAPASTALTSTPFTGVALDFTNYANLAGTPDTMLDAMNYTFLHGQMSAEMRTALLGALGAVTNTAARARTAAYLIFTSSQYQVEH